MTCSYTYRLTDPDGRVLHEIDCLIEVDVTGIDEPVIDVTAVWLDASRPVGDPIRAWIDDGPYCVTISADPLLRDLGARIATAAEKDDVIRERAIAAAGWYVDGHPMDPATRWRKRREAAE